MTLLPDSRPAAGEPAGHGADRGPADHRLGHGGVAFLAAGPAGLPTMGMMLRKTKVAQASSRPAKAASANTNRTGLAS